MTMELPLLFNYTNVVWSIAEDEQKKRLATIGPVKSCKAIREGCNKPGKCCTWYLNSGKAAAEGILDASQIRAMTIVRRMYSESMYNGKCKHCETVQDCTACFWARMTDTITSWLLTGQLIIYILRALHISSGKSHVLAPIALQASGVLRTSWAEQPHKLTTCLSIDLQWLHNEYRSAMCTAVELSVWSAMTCARRICWPLKLPSV